MEFFEYPDINIYIYIFVISTNVLKCPLMLKIFSCSTWFFIFVAQFNSLLKGPHEHSLFLCFSTGYFLLKLDSWGLHVALCPLSSFASTQMGVTHSFYTHLIYYYSISTHLPQFRLKLKKGNLNLKT